MEAHNGLSARLVEEVVAFKEECGDRLPVILVPTKYYATPTDVFRKYGFAAVIWANHLMRSCITAMQRTAQEVFESQTLVRVEDRIAPLAEVFRLQGAAELEEAEKRYLPRNAGSTRAVILAAARGEELGEMTAQRPKCMVELAGAPLLAHVVGAYRAAGIKDIAVVRGYKKEAVQVDGVRFYDAGDAADDAHALRQAVPALEGSCIISPGHVLFKKYIPQELMKLEADFAVIVDANWRDGRPRRRSSAYVTCSEPSSRSAFCNPVRLVNVSADLDAAAIHGEWMGFLKVSARGALFLTELLERQDAGPADLPALLREVLKAGKEIRVLYTTGNWLAIDSVADVVLGSSFQ